MGNDLKKFFSLNGSFLNFMGKIGWVILINIVYIVSCIPIISIGAATKAMYEVMYKLVEDRKVDFINTYLSSLFGHFFTSLKLTLCTLVIGAICVIDILFFFWTGTTYAYIMMGISIVISLVFLSLVITVYPILAKNDGKFKETIKDSIEFMKNYPKSVLAALFSTAVFVAITLAIIAVPQLFMFRYLIFMTFGLNAFVISYIFDVKLNKELLQDELDELEN